MGDWAAHREERIARRASGYERDGLAALLLDAQARALERLCVGAGDRFLDVGCATGAAVRAVSDKAEMAIGVDRCATMIRCARRLAVGHLRARFLVADAAALPFEQASFTAVLCTSALHSFDDPLQAVWEMGRVLEPDGRLVLADFVTSNTRPRWRAGLHRRSGEGSAVRLMAAAGLTGLQESAYLTGLGRYSIISAHGRRAAQVVPDRDR